MMKGRTLVTSISIAFAFFIGRMSVEWIKPPPTLAPPAGVAACEAASPSPNSNVPSSNETSSTGKLAADAKDNSPKSASASAKDCLGKVSRRDLAAWVADQEERMQQFQKTDPQFASMNRLSAADWKKVEGSGAIKAAIAFKFESAISAEVAVQFKEGALRYAIVHRNPADRADQRTTSGSHPLRNGYGIGLENDGSGYHVVFGNSVDADDWSEYSNFAFAVPYDFDRKSEVSTEIYGLNERMKWDVVGTARLTRAP